MSSRATALVETFGGELLRSRRRSYVLSTMPKGAICAEVGVWKGDFSEKIVRTTRPKRIHLIDPWRFEAGADPWWGGDVSGGQRGMDEMWESVREKFRQIPQVEIHRVDSAQCADLFPDEYFDWVYIDGDHSYDAVISDLRLFFRKVKSNGYIAGDDLLFRGLPGYPVMRGVAELLRTSAVEILYASRCQYILRKSSAGPAPPDRPATFTSSPDL